MNGEPVGRWSWTRSGTSVFTYYEEWLASERARPLSLSLPFTPGNVPHRGPNVTAWFDNLLPDSPSIRARVAARFGVRTPQAFDLLAAVGRDCVGAVQLVPDGGDPGDVRRVTGERLTEADVAGVLRAVTSPAAAAAASPGYPDGTGEGRAAANPFRLSIAGAQEKTALLWREGAWHVPTGATPTTHLLKLPLGRVGNLGLDLRASVENEWLCLRLLRAMGLPVAEAAIGRFVDAWGEVRVLVVERFDRRWVDPGGADASPTATGAWIARLPQEDLCQATGTPEHLKYENEGGPGIADCLRLLAGAEDADGDRATFTLALLTFWLLAATDGHAKNFSLFLTRAAHRLTPLYDVISAWPVIGPGAGQIPIQQARLAMALRGKSAHWEIRRIATRHWRALAREAAVPGLFEAMTALVEGSVEATLQHVATELPVDFPAAIWDTVAAGVRDQRQRFLLGLTAGAED